MSSKSIKVFAPASVSNVGPGFDMMGFALNEPGDELILKNCESQKLPETQEGFLLTPIKIQPPALLNLFLRNMI
jgi:homoserine kinase